MARQRRWTPWIAVASVVAVAAVFALWWFTPWKLFTSHRVNDALPAVALSTAPAPTLPGSPTSPSPTLPGSPTESRSPVASPSAAPLPVALLRGTFISHEHATSGTVTVVRQPDGSRVLAIAGLSTSDGPVLNVWLTDQAVTSDGWRVFDDGRYVDLGRLKGTLGNQLYRIPEGADLAGIRSVVIWCDRFDVSFGAAMLA
ncbi:MAG: DM13 domain-containing protein [Jatrophihabitantaceae bacterium]